MPDCYFIIKPGLRGVPRSIKLPALRSVGILGASAHRVGGRVYVFVRLRSVATDDELTKLARGLGAYGQVEKKGRGPDIQVR